MVGSCGGAQVDDEIEVEEVWVRTTGDTGVVETGEAGPFCRLQPRLELLLASPAGDTRR